VLCEVSEMRFGTVDCDDAHCYIADGTVRRCGMLGYCYWSSLTAIWGEESGKDTI